MKTRGIAGLIVIAGGVWFLVTIFGLGPGGREAAEARTFTSSRQCQECHPQPYAEWEESQHALSWINPAVRMLSNDFANQDCIDCHAPRPVFETGIGERVLPRTARRREGVDCISCHQLPESAGGGMAGSIDDPRAACRPVARVELTSADFCAGCHNQHKTVDQWRESEWPDRGQDCLSCHMPFRNGDPNQGRDHRFLGGNHLPMLQEAVELRGRPDGDGWVIEVENVGAGHAFPTDERSRAADLFWRPSSERGGGAETWRHLHRIRDPYRHETDPSTLLFPDETRVLRIDDPLAANGVQVVLFYKRSPYWEDPGAPDPDREAIRVHELLLP